MRLRLEEGMFSFKIQRSQSCVAEVTSHQFTLETAWEPDSLGVLAAAASFDRNKKTGAQFFLRFRNYISPHFSSYHAFTSSRGDILCQQTLWEFWQLQGFDRNKKTWCNHIPFPYHLGHYPFHIVVTLVLTMIIQTTIIKIPTL